MVVGRSHYIRSLRPLAVIADSLAESNSTTIVVITASADDNFQIGRV